MKANAEPLKNEPLQDVHRLSRWGIFVVLGGLIPAAAWMSLAPLSSAVVAPAYVKVDLNRRAIQHAEGGTILQVLVRDGQLVQQGQPLLVLGDVSVDAEKNRLSYRVVTEQASLERLDAEQTAKKNMVFSSKLLESARQDPRLAEQLDKERQLFDARRDALLGQVRLLQLQREKVGEENDALHAQVQQAGESMKYQKVDLETNRKLLAEGFISPNRIAQLESATADYGVKIEEKRADIARTQQRSVEINLRVKALESDYRQQASDQRKASAARLSEIEQELRKSVDASARQVIRSPATGVIIDLKYATAGAVISPRETVADLVPSDTRLVTEARIKTEDINRFLAGQPADIRFTAFKNRSTQLVTGKVIYISPDRLLDRATGAPYYAVLVEADQASLAQAGDLKLQAGMPAEVYIKGEERTPLHYLLEPVTQAFRHAARER